MQHKALVIDGRLLQSSAWHRGMGRYLLGVIGGIVEQGAGTRIVILYSSYLPESERRRKVIAGISRDIEQVTLPILNNSYPSAERSNIKVVDTFLAKNGLAGALFVQTSLFTFEYSPFYPTLTLNGCIFYDMIPFKFWRIFKEVYSEHEYSRRFKFLYKADKVFSISSVVRNDLIQYLGVSPEKVATINGAYASSYQTASGETRDENPVEYGKYILLPGGDSIHKNMFRAAKGFDIFNSRHNNEYKLLVTSFYSDATRQRLNDLSEHIEFVGNVSDSRLEDLYKNAELVMFPSLDEGLGMPILEAVNFDKKIVCSDIAIFKELSKDAFYLFDPLSPSSIASAMDEAARDDKKRRLYKNIRERFTWKNTAERLLSTPVEKTRHKHKGKHSIIVEQNDSIGLIKLLGALVNELQPDHDIDLYISAVGANSDPKHLLIFNNILETRDIADVPKRASSKRTIIFTKSSRYSKAFLDKSSNALYLGTTAREVDRKFEKDFGVSHG